MRKLKKFAVVLLACSSGLMAAFLGYSHVRRDTQPPQISCPEQVLETSIHVTQDQLLEGVSAQDNRDKDVTNRVVVEKLSPITEDDTRVITYAAADEAGNVSRATRTLHYTDYERPRFHISQPMRVPTGGNMASLIASVTADSMLDGDLTPRIKYRALTTINMQKEGLYPFEFRVTDSAGYNLKLAVDAELYNPANEKIKVSLTDSLIYLPLNASFDPMKYYQDSSVPGELEVHSEVNTSVPGVYSVEYVFHGQQDDAVGKNRLVVVVEQ